MKINFLTQVVPNLPPQAGAVGDYALNLARHLRDRCGINSQFILCDPDWSGPARIEDFVIRRLRFPNEACLWGMLASLKQKSPVLLHYDCAAYQKRGVPIWLYDGIHSWLNEGSGQWHKQLFTVFHKLWDPSAKPWEVRFYSRLRQKRLVEKLHGRSQACFTSSKQRQTRLDAIVPGKTLLLPTPSRLPILGRKVPGARPDKPLLAAMFAEPGAEPGAIAHANLLRTLDMSNRLAGVRLVRRQDQSVALVEQEVALLHKSVSARRIQVLEETQPGEVSRLLSSADLFLSPNGEEMAGECANLMAALAAGCASVLPHGRNSAPLQESKHFVASDDSPSSVERFERMAAGGELAQIALAGRAWYQSCADWKVIAQNYQEALQIQAPFAFVPERRLKLPLLTLQAPPS